MPDIDPAALSRPVVTLSTPVLANKTLSINSAGSIKISKSQIIPSRIDLEPAYAPLKAAIGGEQWLLYKEAMAEFLTGRLSQAEYSDRIDSLLGGDNGDKDHLHNLLIAALLGNVTREMPDQGIAPWVSANDKPVVPVASKPVTGDAAERRLKGDVMQLPARDRRRIKDLTQMDWDPHDMLTNTLLEAHRRPTSVPEPPSSAVGSINKMNFDLEIRKRFAQPLAVESGEFPDVGLITGRMLPMCYDAGLAGGHSSEAPQLLSVATETFIKEMLTQIFSRTRSNGPGDSGCAGLSIGTTWIQTRKYQRQLRLEEEAAQRGEMTRDKNGLLPVEAKAAAERQQLGMADMRLSLELADSGMAQFPALRTQTMFGYRDGELENWDDYTWLGGKRPDPTEAGGGASREQQRAPNGHAEPMDVDGGDAWWDGTEVQDVDMLDSVLESCLTRNGPSFAAVGLTTTTTTITMSGIFSIFGSSINPFGGGEQGEHESSGMSRVEEEDEDNFPRASDPNITIRPDSPVSPTPLPPDPAAVTRPPPNLGADGAADDKPPTARKPPNTDNYPSNYNFSRRTSVSAESLKPNADSYDNWSPPKYEKTPEQLERLQRAIGSNFLFSHMEDEQSGLILGAMVEKPVPAKGIKVINQGDAGDFFYVVEKGSFDVHVNPAGAIQPGPDGMGAKVGNIQAGGSFGELALMYNAPRAATVISIEPSCTLWALDRITFRRILMESTFARRRMYESFLEEVPLLSTLTPYERSKIADALETKKFAPGEVIIKEGDPGHDFFLLESGEAAAYKGDTSNQVRQYKKGDFFGELALLNDAPRAASVAASTDVKVATLGKSAFQRLLGPVEGILRRTRYEDIETGVEGVDPLSQA
ncbi:hypothetical protein L249_1017 [Ophiocordyceps polyrhachis-furcata BCC 54312]|uniref:cAMP-dependent protein kinase regulatory subunit n=1 Tax=Ophiocordyceps polyrhachis-furcata BCC 54312 TaxID=1330021 RepID=A0A367LG50_9HYPO|nr:hypothetical protein L249_1017 [Ophiocordyceps polyrhachis-furcata BCC 54312]